MTEQVKLYVFAEGDGAADFLREVKLVVEQLASQASQESNVVVTMNKGVHHGWYQENVCTTG